MPKPIAVMYIPYEDFWGPGSTPAKMMSLFNGWDVKASVGKSFEDYLWFIFIKPSVETLELQVFHEKDFTEIQYEELKQLLIKELQSTTNNTQTPQQ